MTDAIHAVKWSWAGEVASKAIAPLAFVVIATILQPEDMGVFAAATMVTTFVQVIWDGGMGKALIQRQKDLTEAINAAFWINLTLAAVVVILLLWLADHISIAIFKDQRVADVLRVMTLQIVSAAAGACSLALLQRDLEFKRLFWIRFTTVGLPWFGAIPLALTGAGYWSLVAGVVAGQLLQLLLLWRARHIRPRLWVDLRVAGEMGRFGGWVVLSGFLAWFYIWADSLIVGYYLGSHDLGIFRTGNQIAILMYSLVFTPVLPVLYSKLARLDGDKQALADSMRSVILVLATIAIPLGFVSAVVAMPASSATLGRDWNGLGMVLSVMLLAHGYGWIAGMNGEAYRALGRPDLETAIMACGLPIYLIVYIYSIRHGMFVFLFARLGLAIALSFMHIIFIARILRISVSNFIIRMIVLSLLMIGAVGLAFWPEGIDMMSTNTISTSVITRVLLFVTLACGVTYFVYGRSVIHIYKTLT